MTVKEWFTAYAHVVGEEAIINADVKYLDFKCYSLAGALNYGFTWSRTPQGAAYWNALYRELERNYNLYPPIQEPQEIEIW